MIPSVTIIGTGNVAWHMVNLLSNAGYDILEVCGRRPYDEIKEDIDALLEMCPNLEYVPSITQLGNIADIYMICVSDNAIPEVLAALPFKLKNDQILVHTSGSVPSTILVDHAQLYGVLWPIMTLTKQVESEFEDAIPFVITSHNEIVTYHLVTMADQISCIFRVMNDESRKKLHLAAVMANNFSNHLYSLTAAYCEKHELDFDMLQNIISETALKLDQDHPAMLQTGPAKRNDTVTIQSHLQMLEDDPELYKLYCLFTNSIIEKYHPK